MRGARQALSAVAGAAASIEGLHSALSAKAPAPAMQTASAERAAQPNREGVACEAPKFSSRMG